MKFQIDDRVRWRGDRTGSGRQWNVGRVLGPSPDNPLCSRVNVDGSQGIWELPTRRLKHAPDDILLLESRLAPNLRSPRAARDVFISYLTQAHRKAPLYERVHHRDDFATFAAQYSGRARIVHLVSHGSCDGKDTQIHLTRDVLSLREGGKLSSLREGDRLEPWVAALKQKIVILSCCQVGADQEAMAWLTTQAQATAIVAYNRTVTDRHTYVGEPLLYELLLSRTHTYQGIRKTVQDVARFLYEQRVDHQTLDEDDRHLKQPIMTVMTLTDAKQRLRSIRGLPTVSGAA